jgi:hypothetical protein
VHSDEVRRLGQFALWIANVLGDGFDYSVKAPFDVPTPVPDRFMQHWTLIGYRVMDADGQTPGRDGSSCVRFAFTNPNGVTAEYSLEGPDVEQVRWGERADVEALVQLVCDHLWEMLESDPSGKYGVESPYRVVLDS